MTKRDLNVSLRKKETNEILNIYPLTKSENVYLSDEDTLKTYLKNQDSLNSIFVNDSKKLKKIEDGAQRNQNAISIIKHNDQIYESDKENGSVELISGDNVSIEIVGSKIKFSVKDRTIQKASANRDGLMSKEDYTKLFNIEDSANNYVHPDSGIKEGNYLRVSVDKKGHVISGNNSTLTIEEGGTGVTSVEALKEKLEVQHITIDSEVTQKSLNPVSSAGIFNALDKKASINHGNHVPDSSSEPSDFSFLKEGNVWESLPNSTLSGKGIVQLSNKIDGESETVAATEKAVNDVKNSLKSELDDNIKAVRDVLDNKVDTNTLSNYATTEALSDHTSNTTSHITAAERTKWNNAAAGTVTVDTALNSKSNNPISNSAVSTKFESIDSSLQSMNTSISNKVTVISGKGLSTNDLTNTLKSNYDSAYTHSISSHAPSNAERNIIVGIQKNGTDLTVNSTTRKINISVPTAVSELNNDKGYITASSIPSSLPANGGTATKANGIIVCDSRNDNPVPSSNEFNKRMLTADFKINSKINSPTGFSGTFCGVLSLAPWSETSGGHGYQLAFGYADSGHPRLALRGSDLSATSWDRWYKVYTSDDKPTLSELDAAAASHTHTKSQVGLDNVDNTADSEKSVKYATNAGSASSATKTIGVVDYGDSTKTIQIGYGNSGISGDAIKYIAGYTTGNGSDVNAKIKDVSKDALKSWLGLGSLAYSSATIPTIPQSLPANGGNSSTVNGHTVNADVPSGAKFTDTVYTHPSYSQKTGGFYKFAVDASGHVSSTTEVTKSDITSLGIASNSVATTSKNGLMSSTQFKNLRDLISTNTSVMGTSLPYQYGRILKLSSPIDSYGNDAYAIGIDSTGRLYTYFGNNGSTTAKWKTLLLPSDIYIETLTLGSMTLQGNWDGDAPQVMLHGTSAVNPFCIIPRSAGSADVCWIDCYMVNGSTKVRLKNTVSDTKTFTPSVYVIYKRVSS